MRTQSTLGNELSDILGVPCIHLDKLFFKPGWVTPDPEDFRQRVRDALEQNDKGWIVDGSYSRILGDELNSATDVICMFFVRILAEQQKCMIAHL